MKDMITKTGKVSESFLEVFSDYLSSFPVCFEWKIIIAYYLQ